VHGYVASLLGKPKVAFVSVGSAGGRS
jgi:hypothetical protein